MTEETTAQVPEVDPPAPPPPPPPLPPQPVALYGRGTLLAVGAAVVLYASITVWKLLVK